MALGFWFAGLVRGCGGLWRFLTARVEARTAVALEQERNAATAAALQLLPPEAELLEYEANGRLRVIRMARRPGWPPDGPPPVQEVPMETHRELPHEPR